MKLMKLMLAMALVLVFVLALASCGCEHTYDEAITTKPTCVAEGVKTLTCSLCGESHTEAVPAGEHNYKEAAVRPTCTEAGIMTYTCKDCGHSYTEEIEPAKGHTYEETVTPATCVTEGSVAQTCTVCGDAIVSEVLAATGVHDLKTTVVALTDEQKATNPKAIGMESVACTKCDYAEVTTNAVYVYMDFETVPTVSGYEGSDNYKLLADTYKQADANGAGVMYVDMQEHINVTRPGTADKLAGGNAGSGFFMNGDGRLTLATATGYIADELYLVSKSKSALETFTISFDIIHGLKPTKEVGTTKSNKFFCLAQPSQYTQLHSAVLVLDPNSPNEDATAYELVVQRFDYNTVPTAGGGYSISTGFFMNLEKEYSFKLEFDYVSGAMVTILVKETGTSDDYQNLGSFELNPNFGKDAYGHIFFCGSKNSIDNFKVVAPLGAERLPE